eukprot:CAMPEP_0168314814 /NCGR_PEP_ID=MMETSP0210-20121227/9514_1 /TAXON_ID=40633 /ORGANISM="Condylostoma magnum, Strain COL2" /LENGTH=82 /DNA_ID=CAMNT_0008285141 /DNA_START=322 /DNA_END=570 /DNA_ORIENTATION=-
MEILDRTEIGKTVNGLSKHQDLSIQAKAGQIVSKWRKMISSPEEAPRNVKKNTNEKRVPLPKRQKLDERASLEAQEAYTPGV